MRRTVTLAKCLVNCYRAGHARRSRPRPDESACRPGCRCSRWPAGRNPATGPRGRGAGPTAAIRQRGALVCGVAPGVAGFARVDGQGRYSGLDVDVCRAVAAAIFGTAGQGPLRTGLVGRPVSADAGRRPRVAPVDVVAAARRAWACCSGRSCSTTDRVSWSRPGSPRRTVRQLSNARICVVAGGLNESNLTIYFRSHALTLRKVLIQTAQARSGARGGPLRCLHGRRLGAGFLAER